MPTYHAPLDDIQFALHEVLKLDELLQLERYKDLSPDLLDAVLTEAAKFATEQLSSLNKIGDEQGCSVKDGVVTTPQGFKEAYRAFVENGWNSVPFAPEFGGQGLPWLVSCAISEMWSGANMAFALCPLLTQGAVEALGMYGSDAQKATYLEKLISGTWTGTMCLTEPHAGSDVGAVITQAVPNGDHYLIKGQKIFITYGEHDFTDNIIHMVLARVPGAAHGYKGISMFIVPKVLADGTRNDVTALSLEHKMGIHASPTAVLSFGEKAGAIGYLVGEEGAGLKYMFTMMNNARLAVGIEGVAVAENSYQQALAYANERVQGKSVGNEDGTIIHHPDVKRMVLKIRANTEAMRLLACYVAKGIDLYHYHADEAVREKYHALVSLLIPVIKGHGSDLGFEMSSLALQVFGGVGYIEETGIAQNVRDARIAMIYEGTNGIQALDLVTRKLSANDGKAFETFLTEAAQMVQGSRHQETTQEALDALRHIGKELQKTLESTPQQAMFVACDFMRLFGVTVGAVMMAASHKAATEGLQTSPDKKEFYTQKCETADFYMRYILSEGAGLAKMVAG